MITPSPYKPFSFRSDSHPVLSQEEVLGELEAYHALIKDAAHSNTYERCLYPGFQEINRKSVRMKQLMLAEVQAIDDRIKSLRGQHFCYPMRFIDLPRQR